MKHSALFLLLLILISCKSLENVTKVETKYKNIKITESGVYPVGVCEPSIAINPINPNNMVAGNVMRDYHYSNDGGHTWKNNVLVSNKGVFGDPCIVADNEGVFYYLHLSNPDNQAYSSESFLNQIVIQKSENGGQTWSDGVGIGKNEPAQQDKEWMTIHPKTGQLYVTWTEFDKYGSKKSKHKSRIRFATSTNKGESFSQAITISELEGDAVDDDYTTEGAVPAVDNEGNIYVSWAFDNKLYFDKSTDGGKIWNDQDKIIAQQEQGWTQNIPGIGRANGLPVTVVDISNSEYGGTIYVNWTDQRNGLDNTDVFIIKSNDKGVTWSKPIQVNQDTTKTHQFFSWISIDPKTGFLYLVYYDRSRYTNNKTDVVLAISKDGGNSFSNEIISESPFTPNTDFFFGDYNNISAYNGIVRPIWTRYENDKLSIWTAIIDLK